MKLNSCRCNTRTMKTMTNMTVRWRLRFKKFGKTHPKCEHVLYKPTNNTERSHSAELDGTKMYVANAKITKVKTNRSVG
jgi:hypothetical protein